MGLKKTIRRITAIGTLFVLAVAPAGAEWTDPVEILHGSFGSGKGQVAAVANSAGEPVSGIDAVLADGTLMIYDMKNGKLMVFSSAGKLLREEEGKTASSPSDRRGPDVTEASSVKIEKQESGKYRMTVTFSDTIFAMESNYEFPRFVRDFKGRMYGVRPDRIWRFAGDAIFPEELVMPRPRRELPKPEENSGRIRTGAIFVDFGPPVVAPNGDVYCWKTSDLGFAVLKWVWAEEPAGGMAGKKTGGPTRP